MSDLDKLILEVKKLLMIDEDLDLSSLYDQLYRFRLNNHPDKYHNEESKEEAEDKFKNASQLLEKLEPHIEKIKANRSLAKIEEREIEVFEIVEYQYEILKKETKISSLKDKLKVAESKYKELGNKMNKLNDERAKEKKKELKEIYKPKQKSWLIAGTALGLTIIITTLNSLTDIGDVIKNYLPFDVWYFNLVMTIIMVSVIVYNLMCYFISLRVSKASQKTTTVMMVSNFIRFLKEDSTENKEKILRFNEHEVFFFLKKQFVSKKKLSLSYWFFDDVVIDHFKDVFIYDLISKDLVEINKVESLIRHFNVKNDFMTYFLEDIG